MLVKDALDQWLARCARKWSKKHAAHVKHLVGGWKECFGDKEVRGVETVDVGRLEELRDNGRSASALNLERTYLRAFFKWVQKIGEGPGVDPTSTWEVRRVVVEREYVALTEDEEARLVAASPPWLARFIQLAVGTGLREGTVRKLTYRMVTPDGCLEIPARLMKARRPHRVPLSGRVLKAIGTCPELVDPAEIPVCPLPAAATVWRAFKAAAKKAGVSSVASPHDLRRTFVARLSQKGVPAQTIMALGGWRTMGVLLNHYCLPVETEVARRLLEGIHSSAPAAGLFATEGAQGRVVV